MLNIPNDQVDDLKSLLEHVLVQLGKVVNFDLQFDVGYFSSSLKICFVDGDHDIKAEIKYLFMK